MAFEDAATLADVLTANVGDMESLRRKLEQWQQHRKVRIEKVVAFTSRSGDSRKGSPTVFRQILKEWMMWAYFLVKGKEMGLGWMYNYDSEKINL